jgi:ribosomal protein S18 acetylase RimI-like enzyme
MQIDVESLERATLDAVAPPEVVEVEGWLLPMDRSTIGRAISAVPARHRNLSPLDIDAIEGLYQSRELRPQFRLADVAECSNIQSALKAKGYQPVQPTLVQVATGGTSVGSKPLPDVTVRQEPSEKWKSVYLASGFDPIDGQNRVNALSRSKFVRYAHIVENGITVAGGTASYSQGWAGLHGMRTLPEARGRGLATKVIQALLRDIAFEGKQQIYLQVEEPNVAAVSLYQRLGFSTAWRYHYWKKLT